MLPLKMVLCTFIERFSVDNSSDYWRMKVSNLLQDF